MEHLRRLQISGKHVLRPTATECAGSTLSKATADGIAEASTRNCLKLAVNWLVVLCWFISFTDQNQDGHHQYHQYQALSPTIISLFVVRINFQPPVKHHESSVLHHAVYHYNYNDNHHDRPDNDDHHES